MSESKSTSRPSGPDQVRSFWDRYIETLHESGIRPPFDRCLVLRAEKHIEADRATKLGAQGPRKVDDYLRHTGLRGKQKPWQFPQAADAIQKRFELLGPGWLRQVDWNHWRG